MKNTTTNSEDVSGEGSFSRSDAAAMLRALDVADGVYRGGKATNSLKVCKMQDFLALPGTILDNLRANEAGQFVVSLPEGYSSLTAVFIHDNGDIIAREVGLPAPAVPLRDLRHREYLKIGQYYTLQRTRSVLRAGSTY